MKHTEIKENSQKNEDSVFFMVFVNGYDCSLLHIGIILFWLALIFGWLME